MMQCYSVSVHFPNKSLYGEAIELSVAILCRCGQVLLSGSFQLVLKLKRLTETSDDVEYFRVISVVGGTSGEERKDGPWGIIIL